MRNMRCSFAKNICARKMYQLYRQKRDLVLCLDGDNLLPVNFVCFLFDRYT